MYAKIFTQIYDGTLCTKGPWQALVTFQQLLVLADQEGVVDMTIAAISRRTTIPIEVIEIGINELVKPDAESRTPTEQGKRIVLLSEGRHWGWRIVNYSAYRQLNREEDRREYHRSYYLTKTKAKTKSDVSTSIQQSQHPQPIQPIAEAEAKAEAINTVDQPDGFELFYKAYPKKVAEAAARKAFSKVKANASLDLILADIANRLANGAWKADKENKQFIPNPATYLNGHRWKDELTGGSNTGRNSALSRHTGFDAPGYYGDPQDGIPA